MSLDRMISDITVCVTTIDRAHCAQRFIRSVRARYPHLGILLVSQGKPHKVLVETCADEKVALDVIDHDAGVTMARNRAIELASTKYLLYCDDDFIFGGDTDLEPAWRIMEGDESIDILGGLLIDIRDDNLQMRVRRWEKYLFVDQARGSLVTVPIDSCAPAPRYMEGHCYFDTDTVLNWKLVRRALFDRFPGWDPRFQCNGEHEDFYLSVKARGDIRVAYAPSLLVYHHHPPDHAYRSRRQRQGGWPLLGEKWNLENYVDVVDVPPLRRFSHGQAGTDVDELNHPALIANGATVTGSDKIDGVMSEFRRDQVDAGQVRLRLAAGDSTFHASPGAMVSIPVIVESPVKFGCGARDLRPHLAGGPAKLGGGAELSSGLGRTPVLQDVRASSLR
jgi:glycosyltransferase involved in cell wall biosynthesis